MTQYNNLWLKEIADSHSQWVKTVQGIGGDLYSEDIVQEMYLKLHKSVQKRGSHTFLFKDGKLQKGYVFFTLRSILYTYLGQRNKHRKTPIEWLIKNLKKTNTKTLLHLEGWQTILLYMTSKEWETSKKQSKGSWIRLTLNL